MASVERYLVADPYDVRQCCLMDRRKNPIAVCHVARDIAATGGGEVVKQVSSHMVAAGHLVTIVTDTDNFTSASGVRIKRTPFGARLLRWQPKTPIGWVIRHSLQIAAFTVFSSALALGRRISGDVVFNHNCESLVGQVLVMHNTFLTDHKNRPLSINSAILKMLHPVRFMRITKEVVLSRPIFNRILVSVSRGAQGDVIDLAGDERRVRVIPNGVDTEKFAADFSADVPPMVSEWASRGIDEIVLFIGHEWKRKGLDELMDALAVLPASTGVVVVGGASQNLALYQQKASELGVAGRILFAGEWPDVRPFMAAATVFCLPSHAETMPLVALEALAAGLPIVLTPACPAADLIVSGKNGFITTGSPLDIADAIAKAVLLGQSPETRAYAKRSVESQGWSNVATAYTELAYEVRGSTRTLHPRPAADRQE